MHPIKNWFSATAFFLLLVLNSVAQKHTISGHVVESGSGESLIGATVYDARTLMGTSANAYGFFSLTLPQDTVTLIVSYVGYKGYKETFYLDKDVQLNPELAQSITLKEVEIVSSLGEKIEERSQMSTIEIPMREIRQLPVFLGERDVLKTVQLLPGVQSGSEGTSGLYVRGGGPDQNLILLDGVPVYNANHLFGFFSIFNPDAINSVTLIKGGFPARYGGRLSSVLDIRMKEGNNQKLHGEGALGLVSAKLTLEGPVQKGKTSFIVSGRRTYIDILAQPFIRMSSKQSGGKMRAGYYFYDLNTKINHKINDNNRLFLSAYLGKDVAYSKTTDEYTSQSVHYTEQADATLEWGNITTALRWNHLMSKKLFVNTTLTYSRYQFLVGESITDETESQNSAISSSMQFDYTSGIYDTGINVDFDYLPSPNHYIRFGLVETYHTFTPGINTYQTNASNVNLIDTTFGADHIYAHETALYVEDDFKIGTRLKINAGGHLSTFIVRNKYYYSAQPRISARFMINEGWSAKASYATMAQYLHLLTNGTIGLPTDLWLPVTDSIPPQYSRQIAAGIAHTFIKNYELSIEGYYKTMDNLMEYKEGASFFGSSANWEDKVEIGRGQSYGAEVFVQKKEGRLTGWIGYTLSWSWRQFENLNFGKPFPYTYDRRHDAAIAITYKFTEKIDAGLVWVYGTGNATTLPTIRYLSAPNPSYQIYGYNNEIEYFKNRNDYRQPAYHRLDLGFNWHRKKKWGDATWQLGVYNAYNRHNPFYLYFGYDDNGNRKLKMVSLFPIIPSISYSFKF